MRLLIAVVTGLVVSQLATLITTVYLHRSLAHRALTLRPELLVAFRVLNWITTGIRPRQWVAVHRKHHAHTDEPGDPHSPVLEGYAAVQFGNVGMYRREAANPVVVARYARDLPADRWDRLLFDRALVGLSLGIGLLVLVLGWQMGAVAAVVHTVSYLLLNAAINAVGHSFGSRPAPGFSTNNQWLALITSGEGLHNNHHAAPTSARLSTRPGEIDPGWWFIRLLSASRLATLRHEDGARKRLAA